MIGFIAPLFCLAVLQFNLIAATTCNGFGQCTIEQFELKIDIDNTIFTIDHPFYTETKLEIINSNVKRLPTNFFDIWPNLVELSADRCGLEKLPGTGFNLTRLTTLTLSNNRLTELREDSFAGAEQVKELLLSYNLIVNITFGNLTNLKILHLAGNRIQVVTNETFKSLHSLEAIHLDGNHLKYLDFAVFQTNSKLELVDLQRNYIESIDAPEIWSVLFLFLDYNLLHDVGALVNFSSLVSVNLNGNHDLDYSTLDLSSSVSTLAHLNLSETNNLAVNTHLKIFDGLDSLTELAMADNNMTKLDLSEFPRLVSLKQLSIAKNDLITIIGFGQLLEKFPNLTNLEIAGNPWDCSFLEDLNQLKKIQFTKLSSCQKEQTNRFPIWIPLVGAGLAAIVLVAWKYVKRPAQTKSFFDIPLDSMDESYSNYHRSESTVQELMPMVSDDNPNI